MREKKSTHHYSNHSVSGVKLGFISFFLSSQFPALKAVCNFNFVLNFKEKEEEVKGWKKPQRRRGDPVKITAAAIAISQSGKVEGEEEGKKSIYQLN